MCPTYDDNGKNIDTTIIRGVAIVTTCKIQMWSSDTSWIINDKQGNWISSDVLSGQTWSICEQLWWQRLDVDVSIINQRSYAKESWYLITLLHNTKETTLGKGWSLNTDTKHGETYARKARYSGLGSLHRWSQ